MPSHSPAFLAALTGLALALPPALHAQGYPAKPIRLVVPSLLVSSVDVSARVLSVKLPEYLGQPVLLEPRPGHAMIAGSEAVSKAAPDGYTLLVIHDGGMVMNALSLKRTPDDALRDFTPLSLVSREPLAIVAQASTGARSIKELISSARNSPGKLNSASSNLAVTLAIELFNTMAKTDIVAVPYKGIGEALNSVLVGETHVGFVTLGGGAAAMKSDKVRVLALTSASRSAIFPDVPTVDESGLPGYEMSGWVGLFGPPKLPAEIANRLTTETRKAIAYPEIRGTLRRSYLEPVGSAAEDLGRALIEDMEKWTRVARVKEQEGGRPPSWTYPQSD